MKNTSTEGFPAPYGKYELLARIGQGGMAEVFRARLPGVAGFEKILVIKRLLPHLARMPSVVEMFVNEAKLAAQVQHRNVVQVFELGQVEGEFYMAMEHVAGTDLRQILRAAAVNSMRIPPWFSVHVVAEVLDGLAFAHALTDESGRHRNVVHRDVTPANIFVSYMGDTKLGDFGVAKDEGRSKQTRAGTLKGKVPYMSPEQLYGRELDQRTDVFAAGVVLWECLTQRRLFGGRPDIEAMNLICFGDRKPPSTFASDVPPELDAIVLAALSPDVERRLNSARDFQQQLLDVLPMLRPRVHQNDVRNIVEVVLGNRDPSANTGPKSIQDDSVVRHNFMESTPGYDTEHSTRAPSGSRHLPSSDVMHPIEPPQPHPQVIDPFAQQIVPQYQAPPQPQPQPQPRHPSYSQQPPARYPSQPPAAWMAGMQSGQFAAPPAMHAPAPMTQMNTGSMAPLVPPHQVGQPMPAPHDPRAAYYGSATGYAPAPATQPMPAPHPSYGAQHPWPRDPPPAMASAQLQPPQMHAAQIAQMQAAQMQAAQAAQMQAAQAAQMHAQMQHAQAAQMQHAQMQHAQAAQMQHAQMQHPQGVQLYASPAYPYPVAQGVPYQPPPPQPQQQPYPPRPSHDAMRPHWAPPAFAAPHAQEEVPEVPPLLDPDAMVPLAEEPLVTDDFSARNKTPSAQLASEMDALVQSAVADAIDSVAEIAVLDSTDLPREEALPGLTTERAASRVSDHARGLWKEHVLLGDGYEGPYPFWVRAHDGTVVGPLAYDDALNILSYEAKSGHIEEVSISATQQRWMSGESFAMFTGQEMLLDRFAETEKELPKSAISGTFSQTSPTALFARLTRERVTGRLIIVNPGFGRFVRREIVLSEGQPTFVYANQKEQQLPELLVQKNIVSRDQLADLLHRVVLEDRSLEEIVAHRTGYDLARYWTSFMKERLVDLFKWTSGRYALDPNAPITHTTPFAHSLASLLPEMVYRSKSADELRLALTPHMDTKLERSERFNRGVADLRLSEQQKKAVIPFGSGRTLAQSLKAGLKEERLNLAMAYILLEADLLLLPL